MISEADINLLQISNNSTHMQKQTVSEADIDLLQISNTSTHMQKQTVSKADNMQITNQQKLNSTCKYKSSTT